MYIHMESPCVHVYTYMYMHPERTLLKPFFGTLVSTSRIKDELGPSPAKLSGS